MYTSFREVSGDSFLIDVIFSMRQEARAGAENRDDGGGVGVFEKM